VGLSVIDIACGSRHTAVVTNKGCLYTCKFGCICYICLLMDVGMNFSVVHCTDVLLFLYCLLRGRQGEWCGRTW